MKTLVYIMFNGAASEHIFDIEINDFKNMWDGHINADGFFTGVNQEGTRVIINPSQCPVIEIRQWNY